MMSLTSNAQDLYEELMEKVPCGCGVLTERCCQNCEKIAALYDVLGQSISRVQALHFAADLLRYPDKYGLIVPMDEESRWAAEEALHHAAELYEAKLAEDARNSA